MRISDWGSDVCSSDLEWPADIPGAALEAVWPPLQEELASLVPDSRLVVDEESGHYIQLEQPDLVTEAIRQAVDAVRDPASWAKTGRAARRERGCEVVTITGAAAPLKNKSNNEI